MLRKQHIVVAQEDDVRANLGALDEPVPFLNQGLARLVGRMSLAREDQLHWTLGVGQKAYEPRRILEQQVRPLISRKAARKSEGQCAGPEGVLCSLDLVGGRPRTCKLQGETLANVGHEGRPGSGTKLPEPRVADAGNPLLEAARAVQPTIFTTGLRPQVVGRCRIPSWHVDSIGDVPDRHFILRPMRKQRPEQPPAHLPVQATHAIDGAAPADGQIGHVEILRHVARILAAKCQ